MKLTVWRNGLFAVSRWCLGLLQSAGFLEAILSLLTLHGRSPMSAVSEAAVKMYLLFMFTPFFRGLEDTIRAFLGLQNIGNIDRRQKPREKFYLKITVFLCTTRTLNSLHNVFILLFTSKKAGAPLIMANKPLDAPKLNYERRCCRLILMKSKIKIICIVRIHTWLQQIEGFPETACIIAPLGILYDVS